MSNNINRDKFLKNGNSVRTPILNRGPLVRSKCDTALKNVTNFREVDPEEDQPSQNSQNTGQMNFVVPKYQLVQEPLPPSVSYSVLFQWFMLIYRVIIERALANSDRLGSTCPLLTGRSIVNH